MKINDHVHYERAYTEFRSIHHIKNDNEEYVRITYLSDGPLEKDVFKLIHKYYPQLKNEKHMRVHYDNEEWLCAWKLGNPKGGAFMIINVFYK